MTSANSALRSSSSYKPSSLPRLSEVKAELASRDFFTFFKEIAWPVLLPHTPFKDNWHIHAICDHLQAVNQGQIKRLMIHMPFRLLKSTIISQAFPAWEWINMPHLQYLTASYAIDLATRDAVNSRKIIRSTEYQQNWGHKFLMIGDQNVKSRYENDQGGSRTVTATDAKGTGYGGNRLTIDDPISSKDANSEVATTTSIEWWNGTMSTRLNDPVNDVVLIVHQRLGINDLSGYLLREQFDLGWEQLILPMRYEPEHTRTTIIGFKDPRTKAGELLHPERIPEEEVIRMERTLGKHGASAQLQQRPTARGGMVIKGEWFPRFTVHPRLTKKRIYADTAQKTKQRNDYSVFQLWGLGDDGKIYLLDQIRGKWESYDLEQKARDFWAKHREPQTFSATLSKMLVEDKSSGTGLIQSLRKAKDGVTIPVYPIPRHIDKLVRCYDGQPYMEAGLVCLPQNAPWVSDLVEELESFTKDDTHAHDDQIDPMLDAINDLLGTKKSIFDAL